MRLLCKRLFHGAMVLGLAAGVVTACTNYSSAPNILGHVKVLVVDSATNAGIGGRGVTLLLPDRTTGWRALITTADGTGEFGAKDGGVIAGTYIVRLDLLGTTYSFAGSDTNDKPIQVAIGQTQTVTFKLKKGSITPPGGG